MAAICLFILFALFQPVFLYPTAQEQKRFLEDCPPYTCGNLGNIGFPFTNITRPAYCGLLVVDGCDKELQMIQLERGKGRWYEVEKISQDNTMKITDTQLQGYLNNRQCKSFKDLSFPSLPYGSYQIMSNLTLFKCNRAANVIPNLDFSYQGCKKFSIHYTYRNRSLPSLPPSCSIVQLPIDTTTTNYSDIFKVLSAKFSLQMHVSSECYQCQIERGKCQLNSKGNFQCVSADEENSKKKVITAATAASVAGIGVLMIAVCCLRRNFSFINLVSCCKKKSQVSQGIEDFLKNYESLAPHRYSYSEVKKMTNSFKDKLGQGGFGGVFKGKLPDGHLVAVKVLKESKSNGEEFINEVASISRTSHVNIVTLLGFCFEGSKRALIYEFMSNGSLEKYIANPSNADRQLGWEKFYEIALGIAQGLAYLHKGCNTRILHFDIKPHNILLDENFCPKISDFGLAKICPKTQSTVSMLDARGTVGYIAPEVFCRNFGGVSPKSDVYSYGMLVLEMVGARNNVRVGVDNTSEIYFPDWIHKRLELGEQLGLHGIGSEEEDRVARKLILVSLWCIQIDPSNRPPMCRVIEMLRGSLESLPIPPRPCMSSPSRPPLRSTTNSSTVNVRT